MSLLLGHITRLKPEIPWYNLANGIGLIFVILLLEKDFRKQGDYKRFPSILISAISAYVFGWVVSHFSTFFQMGYLSDGKSLSSHTNYGFSFLGGFIGAFLMFVILLRMQRFNIDRTLDRIAPLVPLAHAFGRIGCYLGGCCYGRFITVGGHTFQFPTQLVSAGILFILFFILYFNKFSINRAYLYFLLYSTFRFAIEFLRGDARGRLVTDILSPAQEFSLLIICITLIVYFTGRCRQWGAITNAKGIGRMVMQKNKGKENDSIE